MKNMKKVLDYLSASVGREITEKEYLNHLYPCDLDSMIAEMKNERVFSEKKMVHDYIQFVKEYGKSKIPKNRFVEIYKLGFNNTMDDMIGFDEPYRKYKWYNFELYSIIFEMGNVN